MLQSKEEATPQSPLMGAILHNFKNHFIQPLSNCKLKLSCSIFTHLRNDSYFCSITFI